MSHNELDIIHAAGTIINKLRTKLRDELMIDSPLPMVYCSDQMEDIVGEATVSPRMVTIELNGNVFSGKTHTKAFYNTVVHEFAHVVQLLYDTETEDYHGPFWQKLMNFFEVEPLEHCTDEELDELGVTFCETM